MLVWDLCSMKPFPWTGQVLGVALPMVLLYGRERRSQRMVLSSAAASSRTAAQDPYTRPLTPVAVR